MARRDESITQKAATVPPSAVTTASDAAEPESERSGPSRPLSASADLMVGPYETLFELARGGMGTVYVARRSGAHGFDRLVALKRLDVRGESEASDVEAFLREARLTARINHPNVVQTQELFEDDRSPVMVMDLVQGVSLAKLLARMAAANHALDPDIAGYITIQIANGLHAAHELTGADGEPLGLVHRDVSPQNILVSTEGRVYVADFGIAKLAEGERATRSGVVKGKFGYMAPEQTRAEELDRRADVFGLGIVLHEMLTGKRLFDAPSPAAIILQINGGDVADPRRARPEIAPVWAELSLACLTRDREDRIGSAKRVADIARGHLRERGLVDDSDVAALVTRFAATDLARLRAKMKRCDTTRTSTRALLDSGDEEEGAGGAADGTVTGAASTRRVPAGSRALPSRWIGATIAFVLLVGGIWWSAAPSGRVDPQNDEDLARPTRASDPSPADSDEAMETPAPTPSVSPSGSASAASQPILTPSAALTVRPVWRPGPVKVPTGPPAATSSSIGTPQPGEPFPTLR